MTYRRHPPFASILKAVEVPPIGGDTLWAGMSAVHDALDPGLRRDLEQLEAVHDMGAFRTGAYLSGGDEGVSAALTAAGSAVHPVIAHHQRHRRPYVNVSESFTRFIIGLSAPESARLLTHLFDLINRPDFHMRVKWKPGMVVMWTTAAPSTTRSRTTSPNAGSCTGWPWRPTAAALRRGSWTAERRRAPASAGTADLHSCTPLVRARLTVEIDAALVTEPSAQSDWLVAHTAEPYEGTASAWVFRVRGRRSVQRDAN